MNQYFRRGALGAVPKPLLLAMSFLLLSACSEDQEKSTANNELGQKTDLFKNPADKLVSGAAGALGNEVVRDLEQSAAEQYNEFVAPQPTEVAQEQAIDALREQLRAELELELSEELEQSLRAQLQAQLETEIRQQLQDEYNAKYQAFVASLAVQGPNPSTALSDEEQLIRELEALPAPAAGGRYDALLDGVEPVDLDAIGLDEAALADSIPRVAERDLDPSAGPRIQVLKIRIEPIKEHPEFGITQVVVEQVANQQLEEVNRQIAQAAQGYSDDDLLTLANRLTELDHKKAAGQLAAADLLDLLDLIQPQQAPSGLSFGQIEDIADQVTDFYREKGYFLAKTYVPAQDVDDGVVSLAVLDGELGDILVTGNDNYSESQIRKPFESFLGESVHKDQVETALYALNDYPGIDAFGYFSAGEKIGETQLNIRIREEKRWSALLRADNHGSEFTGENRLLAIYEQNNLSGGADLIRVGIMQTLDPENSTFGLFDYRYPLYRSRFKAGFSASLNDYAIGAANDASFDVLGLSGEVLNYGPVVEYQIKRSRANNQKASLSVTRRESELESEELPDQPQFNRKESINNITLGYNFDALFQQLQVFNEGGVFLAYGNIEEGVQEDQEEQFIKLSGNYAGLTFIDLPWLDKDNRFLINLSAQYSDEALPGIEQFSLAGANGVRAFLPSELSADSGAVLSAEFYFNAPNWRIAGDSLTNIFQPYVFIDSGYGHLNSITEDQADDVNLSGWGIGAQLSWRKTLTSKISLAAPLTDDSSDEEPLDDLIFLFDIQYKLN